MKRVIYGVLILVGGLLIASNFYVDNNKIDHKTARASGTACRWIGESGYGVGPYYIDEDKNNIESVVGGLKVAQADFAENIFSVFPCVTSNSGESMDGNLLYTESGDLYNGYFGLYYIYHHSNDNLWRKSLVIEVSDGELKSYSVALSGAEHTVSNFTSFESNGNFFNSIAFQPLIFIKSGTAYAGNYSNNFILNYEYDVNNDGKNIFTCVCAEY